MALRISTRFRNFVNQHGSWKQALQNGKIVIYTGAQPADADNAVSGSELVTFTSSAGAHTNEVQASTTITLSGSTSGSVDTVTIDSIALIDSAVAYNASFDQTATDLAAAINKGYSQPEYIATASGAVVTIKALPGAGVEANGLVVASTSTGLTSTPVTPTASGVDPVNGLKFQNSASGILAKLSTQTWSGLASASGTAGWFRFHGAVVDAGAADTGYEFLRLDGSVATSGGQLNVNSTSITSGATETITSFPLTMPAY
jgi:hypothetical protein